MKRAVTVLLGIFIFFCSSPVFAEESAPDSFHPKWIGWFRAGYDYDFADEAVNGFNNYSARIIAKGSYDERISYLVMTEMINQSSADSRPIFLQGWIDYKLFKQLSAKIGQFKYPFGRDAYGTVMAWKFAHPSYISGNIAKKLGRSGGFYRDVGVQVTGSHSLNEKTAVFTRLMVMNGNGINSTDENRDKDFVGQVGVKLPYNIEIGGSYFTGKDESWGGESAFNGYFIMKYSRLHAQAEYSRAVYENNGYGDIEPAGFYAFATYELYPHVEAGARYERYESNMNLEDTDRDRVSLMAAYNFSEMTRIMLNYEIPGGTRNEGTDDFMSLNFYVAFN